MSRTKAYPKVLEVGNLWASAAAQQTPLCHSVRYIQVATSVWHRRGAVDEHVVVSDERPLHGCSDDCIHKEDLIHQQDLWVATCPAAFNTSYFTNVKSLRVS